MLRNLWDSIKESSFSWVLLFIGLSVAGYLCILVIHKLLTRLKECYFKNLKLNLWLPSIILGIMVLAYRLPISIIVIHFAVIFLLIDLITNILGKLTNKEFRFLHSGLLSIILSIIICTYGVLNFIIVVPHEYVIESENVSKEYTAVFISDIHGPMIPMTLFKKYVNKISDLNADFVLLAGDITDEFAPRVKMEETYNTLGKIKNKYGIYYTYGNHDRLKYARKIDYDKDILDQTIKDSGITILKDENVVIDNQITLIGRDDSGSEGKNRMNMGQLLENVDMNTFVTILEHEPSPYNDIARKGVDLYLYGHTHSGQIFPIGFYFQTFWNAFKSGREKYNNLDIIISPGFGAWAIPFRTEAHSEYIILKIVPKG